MSCSDRVGPQICTAAHLTLQPSQKKPPRIKMLKLVAASATVATVLGAPTVPKTTERFNEVRALRTARS